MKLVGEKAIGSFLVELEKDNLKMTKIRECCEKAVITVKVTGVKKERPTTAPSKAAGGDVPRGGSAAKGAKRPTSKFRCCILCQEIELLLFNLKSLGFKFCNAFISTLILGLRKEDENIDEKSVVPLFYCTIITEFLKIFSLIPHLSTKLVAPAPKKKPPAEANSGTSIKSKPSRTLKPTPSSTQKEKEMSEEEALEALSNIIDLEVLSGLADNNWKNR